MRILLASDSLTEAITHLHLFRSSSHDSQNVSVELSLRLATMATRLDTFKSREAVMSIRPSTVVSASLKRPQGTAPLLSNSSDLKIHVYIKRIYFGNNIINVTFVFLWKFIFFSNSWLYLNSKIWMYKLRFPQKCAWKDFFFLQKVLWSTSEKSLDVTHKWIKTNQGHCRPLRMT